MPGDNGGVEEKGEPKTPEQLAQKRLERYQKDPLSFVELSELVCGAIKWPGSQLGVAVMVGQNIPRSLLNNGVSELNYIVNKIRMDMDIRAEMMKQSKIVPAKHGIMDFMRGRK